MKLCTHEGLTLNDVTKNMLQEWPLWIKKLRFYKVDDVTHSNPVNHFTVIICVTIFLRLGIKFYYRLRNRRQFLNRTLF